MGKAKAASSARAQAGAFLSTPFDGASGFSQTTSTFGGSFGSAPPSQLSYVYEPPELDSLSDPSVVVSWKNLQKKDSSTKTRALDELLAYVATMEEHGHTLEDGFLEAWIKLYARVSIDNARPVRQRAHTLQGRIAALLGKRIAKSLPRLIGPWLCGLHDNDKLVVRATQDSLSATFATEEKRLGVWNVYHSAILDYCSKAILYEDTKTLSDERSTIADDAEAKFSRTIGSATLTVARALEVVHDATVEKNIDAYKEILDSDKLWGLVDSSDSFLRQAVYRITLVRLAKLDSSVDALTLQKLSKALLSRGLRRDQAGSVLSFVELLAILTKMHPTVWTTHFSSQKKPAPELLEQFLRRLPSGLNDVFWESLRDLLTQIPAEVIGSVDNGNDEPDAHSPNLLAAFQHGLSRKDAFKVAPAKAWEVFLTLARRYNECLRDQDSRDRVVQDSLQPLVRRYVLPDSENTGWSVGGSLDSQFSITWQALSLGAEMSTRECESVVQAMSTAAIEFMQTSLPEQSQGFEESQRKVGSSFSHWNRLKHMIHESLPLDTSKKLVGKISEDEVRAAMDLLLHRNGKPFGAALVIYDELSQLSSIILANQALKRDLVTFATQLSSSLDDTPSMIQILDIFRLVDTLMPGGDLSNKCLAKALGRSPSSTRTRVLTYYSGSHWPASSSLSEQLSAEVKAQAAEFLNGDSSRAPELESTLANKSAPPALTDSILADLTEALTSEETARASLQILIFVANQNQNVLQRFLNDATGSALGPKLVLLSKSLKDSESQKFAADLSTRVRMISAGGSSTQTMTGLTSSIQDGLKNTSTASMTVEVLTGLADQVLKDGAHEASEEVARGLLPSDSDWHATFDPFASIAPDHALATTNQLNGAVHWLQKKAATTSNDLSSPSHDSLGHSVAVRMIMYTLHLFAQPDFRTKLNTDVIRLILFRFAVFNEVLTDNISIPAAVPLWVDASNSSDDVIYDLLARSQELLGSIISNDSALQGAVLSELLGASEGPLVTSYYAARAYVTMANEVLEIDPSGIPTSEDDLMRIIRAPTGSLKEAAKFATAQQGAEKSKVANSLVAELARFNFAKDERTGLFLLTLLNCLLRSPTFSDVAFNQQHRLVLFAKHITGAIRLEVSSQPSDSEMFNILVYITPLVKDIFDNFWTGLIDKLIKTFTLSFADSSILEPALRLVRKLGTLTRDEETNEDLKESWATKSPVLSEALIQLLRLQADTSDVCNQPRRIMHDSLARQIDSLQPRPADISSLFPVLASKSFVLQRSAFRILHKAVPAMQEKVTMEAALNKEYAAKLPKELLQVVSDAPSEVQNLIGAQSLPSQLVNFLYAWKVIYDHWSGASRQVQNNYFEDLRSGQQIHGLLDFVLEVAVNSRAKPLDASKYEFEDMDSDMDDNPDRDYQQFLCHLYLLSLINAPGLVRAWWRDCPRNLSKSIEDWTEKCFSPTVVATELAEVTAWATKQETDTPLEIKVFPKAREVVASYELDEQMSAIRVVLPANYPLGTIAVETVNRVGVDERKWRTWMLASQGVMNFASSSGGLGAVIDGLVGFRRNVTGTLDGHTECAICYSVVNADRQLPTKKCTTCKNVFHGSCLFKWFRNSGGSGCPLCRAAFNYG